MRAGAATATSPGRLRADRTCSSCHPVSPAAPAAVARQTERRLRLHVPGTRAARQRCAVGVAWSVLRRPGPRRRTSPPA